jgi:hypothetical protein
MQPLRTDGYWFDTPTNFRFKTTQERKTKSVHRSPGMKYRHYSPNAKIILIEGPKDKVKDKILHLLS